MNNELMKDNKFATGHGYTKGEDDYEVVNVKPDDPKDLSSTNRAGDRIWPDEPINPAIHFVEYVSKAQLEEGD